MYCIHATRNGTHTGLPFVYENGDSYIPFGTTVYALIHQDDALEKETLQTLHTSPFNKIRFCVFPKSYELTKMDLGNSHFAKIQKETGM